MGAAGSAGKCRGRRVPIVAFTAHAMNGDRSRCFEAGMDDYLTKPLKPDALAKSLTRWMPRHMAAATVTGTTKTESPAAVPPGRA